MKQAIVELLQARADYVSSQELCDQFHVSRTAVWKVINQLKEEGYKIESVTRKGYRLLESADVITDVEIIATAQRLGLCPAGKLPGGASKILYFDAIDSTNIKAAQCAEQGAESGLLVVSDRQTAGKGRRGRSWDSPAGTGIFMSLMLKPDIHPNHASMLTLVAAIAVARAITRAMGPVAGKEECQPLIKWPNDIVMNGHKVCGILTEMSAQMDYINHLVIGIGINVHNTDFPEEIKATASSIYKESGKSIHRAELIALFLDEFDKAYQVYLKTEDLQGLLEEYNEILVNKDRPVRVLDPKGEFDGVAQGINEAGELLVTMENGETTRIYSGEVSVRGIYGYV